MNMSVRTKFTLGILFFFVIILLMFVFSAIQLNKLSKKTGLILTENHVSVVYAREMSEALSKVNHELTSSFINSEVPDNAVITETLKQFANSLNVEKNNITEVGEDKLVSVIESDFNEYSNALASYLKNERVVASVTLLQNKYIELDQQLMLLSQMNEKAIELKTSAAMVTAKKALTQMAVLGTFCFLIAVSFTYSFSSYFNERFTQLYGGIKEIVSSNYGQRLHFEGRDEFYEIASVFNEMAESLTKSNQYVPSITLKSDEKEINLPECQELKVALMKIRAIEAEVAALISKYE
jgi:hypothetical protein